jgi:ubiquinone biosynthesis protein
MSKRYATQFERGIAESVAESVVHSAQVGEPAERQCRSRAPLVAELGDRKPDSRGDHGAGGARSSHPAPSPGSRPSVAVFSCSTRALAALRSGPLVLRSLRALLLFWTVFASYGVGWPVALLLGKERGARFFERLHKKNARRLARGFSRLRGVFIKMGQVLSVTGTFLPPAFGEALQELQDKVPPRPFPEIQGRLREAFGSDPLARFGSFEPEPIAAASLAQVHRATTRDGVAVAVKVLYPNIERLIAGDLRVLRSVLPVIRLLVPIGRVERMLDQLEAMLARETDYAHERQNMERLRAVFAARKDVVVPTVIGELTNGGVLSMTFEEGVKITDFEGQRALGVDTEAVGRLLIECYFEMLLRHRVFHADPHPGNFLVRSGPALVILDYGAVEEVTPALAEGMKMVVMGVLTKNDELILQGLEHMGFVAQGGDRELLKDVGREYLKVLAGVKIGDFSRLDRDAIEKLSGFQQVRGRLRAVMKSVEYPDGYFYVERTLVLLFGLAGHLSPKLGLPGLVLPYAAQFFGAQKPQS